MLSGSSPASYKRLMKASIWEVQPAGTENGMFDLACLVRVSESWCEEILERVVSFAPDCD